eukprot:scaffold1677_cov122-Cylindrotheca_fusiformis.AAC.10
MHLRTKVFFHRFLHRNFCPQGVEVLKICCPGSSCIHHKEDIYTKGSRVKQALEGDIWDMVVAPKHTDLDIF